MLFSAKQSKQAHELAAESGLSPAVMAGKCIGYLVALPVVLFLWSGGREPLN